MKKELPWIRRLQKQAMVAATTLAEKASVVVGEAKVSLKKLDVEYDITSKLSDAGDRLGARARKADHEYGLTAKGSAIKQVASVTAALVNGARASCAWCRCSTSTNPAMNPARPNAGRSAWPMDRCSQWLDCGKRGTTTMGKRLRSLSRS